MKPASTRWLLPVAALLALAACSGGTKLQPPAASIQQLQALPSGQWQLTVRIENYSYDTAMHVYTLDADLSVGGAAAGHLTASPGLDIPEMTGDVATATITPGAAARAALDHAGKNALVYELKGHIGVGKGEGGSPQPFDIDGKGYLSPVPGVANTWR
ncbi:MAG: LEA type 2 family protein [Proteobacteria bacterium]|nr:LEA type 2 family protein [Pseudomonadota bacterium]